MTFPQAGEISLVRPSQIPHFFQAFWYSSVPAVPKISLSSYLGIKFSGTLSEYRQIEV